MSEEGGMPSRLAAVKANWRRASGIMASTVAPRSYFDRLYRTGVIAQKSGVSIPGRLATVSFDVDREEDVHALPALLEDLQSFHAKCSFACVGALLRKFPREHASITDHGHEVINHSDSHRPNEVRGGSFFGLPERVQEVEIRAMHHACRELLGVEPTGFRAPHFANVGRWPSYEVLCAAGYRYSSSVLSTVARIPGRPHMVGPDLIEFPLATCPDHPAFAFDTYHAFRSEFTKHASVQSLANAFQRICDRFLSKGLHANIYLDPADAVQFGLTGPLLSSLIDAQVVPRPYGELALASSFDQPLTGHFLATK